MDNVLSGFADEIVKLGGVERLERLLASMGKTKNPVAGTRYRKIHRGAGKEEERWRHSLHRRGIDEPTAARRARIMKRWRGRHPEKDKVLRQILPPREYDKLMEKHWKALEARR